MNKISKDNSARPGWIIKKDIQSLLHRNETFQSISGIIKAIKYLGLKNFWSKFSDNFPTNLSNEEIKVKIRSITLRRNQIVHEADIILQQSTRKIKLRDVTKKEAQEAVEFIVNFIAAVEELINNNC